MNVCLINGYKAKIKRPPDLKNKRKTGESVMFKASVKVVQIIRDGGTTTATLACRADSLDLSSPQGGGVGVYGF